MGSKRSYSPSTVKTVKRALLAGISLLAAGITTPALADFDDAMRTYSEHSGQIDQAKVREAVDLWRRYALAGDVLSRYILGDLYSNQSLYDCKGPVPDDGNNKRAKDEDRQSPPLPSETGAIEISKVEALAWYLMASTHDFETHNQQPDFRMINCKARAETRVHELMTEMSDDQVRMSRQMLVNLLSSQSEFDLFRLGQLYQSGKGLPKDNIEALKYYIVASTRMRNSNPHAVRASGRLKKIMSRDDIETAEEEARLWMPPLPDTYTNPNPVLTQIENQTRALDERRLALAIEEIEREFSDRNEHLVQGALASLGLYLGPIDGARGELTRKAIQRFQYNLVEDNPDLTEEEKRDGMTGELTPAQTVALIGAAADVNHPQSQYIFGVMHAEGIGVPVNGKRAVKWLNKSAAYGYPLGHYALGQYYREGIWGEDPIPPSRTEAAHHFGQAAALGYRPARKALEELYEFGYGNR